MAELKAKVTLKQKGEEAYVSLKQLMASLKWTAAVDLDLMAFYKAKDGRVGGIFSDNYAGGSMGSLNSFPFIQLSGDAGVGATGGENEETLRITKLDDLAELYICTINFTDAVQNRDRAFSSYDAYVLVVDDKGESVAVPLDSTEPGTVAVIAKIDNTGFMGAKMINENRVMDMATFQNTIPGANTLKLASKVVLQRKGDSARLKAKYGGGLGEILVNLNWNQGQPQPQKKGLLGTLLGGYQSSGIDLDLGCLFEMTTGEKSAIQPLGNAFGAFDRSPFILHCGDDRTGAWSSGENMRINGDRLREIKRVLVYAYIYEGIANWLEADGIVTIIQTGAPDIVVALDEGRNMPMCAIALFENIGDTFSVKKVVQYFSGQPEMDRAFNWGLQWIAGSK
ncbi:MAG: stress response protein [Hormoscilla sp.]